MFGRAFRQPHQVAPSTQLLTTVQPPSRVAPGVHTTSKRSTLQKGDEVLLRDLRPSVGKGEATWQSTTTTVYFNEVVFPSVLGLTSPMAFPQHSPPP